MKITRFRRGALFVVVAVLGFSSLGSAGANSPCATPNLSGPGYARGSKNTVTWQFGLTNGGTEVQASASSLFTSPIVLDVPAGGFSAQFNGLDERRYHYRARSKAGSSCTRSDWSNTVQTIQDQTAPTVEFTTRPEPIVDGTPLTPPQPLFIMQDTIRIDGRSFDPPGGNAPSGSGPAFVEITLQNTTPVTGTSSEPMINTEIVDTDNTWLIDYDDLPSGTYTASVVGIDAVGNKGDTEVTLGVIVLYA